MAPQDETLEGCVADIARFQTWPRAEWAGRAARHSRHCIMEEHCRVSARALVRRGSQVVLLDPAATQAVANAVRHGPAVAGIRLRVMRTDGLMASSDATEIEPGRTPLSEGTL